MQTAYAGHCYATETEALGAFNNSFPLLGDAGIVSFSSSSISAAGVLDYQLVNQALPAGTMTTITGSMQLASCDPVDVAKFDPAAAGGVFAFFFLGVAGLWYFSKNIGLILEAVRKF